MRKALHCARPAATWRVTCLHLRIVTLAAALALPLGVPSRDLIVLAAFLVKLRTLLIQRVTLKPLLRALKLHEGKVDATGWGLRNFPDEAAHQHPPRLRRNGSPGTIVVAAMLLFRERR